MTIINFASYWFELGVVAESIEPGFGGIGTGVWFPVELNQWLIKLMLVAS